MEAKDNDKNKTFPMRIEAVRARRLTISNMPIQAKSNCHSRDKEALLSHPIKMWP